MESILLENGKWNIKVKLLKIYVNIALKLTYLPQIWEHIFVLRGEVDRD